MNAPPSAASGSTPNGGPPRRRFQRPKANPLLPNRRPAKPKPVQPPPSSAPTTQDTQSASALPPSAAASSASTPVPAQPSRPAFLSRPRSPTPEGEPQIIPVYTTKRELLEGLRFHYAKLQSTRGENLNILDESKFTRPIRLHRREQRPIFADDAMDVDEKEDVVDDKEKERLEAAKLDRQRQREENAKQIAPTASSKRKLPAFKKKTEQVYRTDDTPEERKRNLLRYEETLPWHLEDDDNKNVWVGTYEEALSEKYILLLPEEGRFRMVPVEKFYRFRQKGKAKQVDYDTAEKMMSAKSKEPRWIMKHKEKQQKEKDLEAQSNKARGLYTRLGDRLEDAENAKEFGEVAPNVDEMDFNVEEEFADDEENPIFEGDDDTLKEAEDKMRKDQLEANTFGAGDETKVDEEEEAKMLAYAVKRAQGKDILKALRKREKRYDQEDISDEMDSDESDSDISDSDQAKDERQRDDSKAGLEKGKGKEREGDKVGSGASSKGTNTPSGRKKQVDVLNHRIPSNILKRPSSPNLSDASGNESSRPGKKLKKSHSGIKGTSTPLTTSQTSEPIDSFSRQPSLTTATGDQLNRKLSAIGGAGSDSEGATDPNRSGFKLRLKLSSGSANGTPRGSRPSSPAPASQARAATPSRTGSRATSPVRRAPSPVGITPPPAPETQAPGPPPAVDLASYPLPAADEILAVIPPQGLLVNELSTRFKGWAPRAQELKGEWAKRFIALVKQVTNYDPKTKVVRRRA